MTINNEHKKLNVPNKREQNQTCLDSAEREGLRPKGNVPNLRFPEFQGEWEESIIGEMFDLYSGNTPSRLNKEHFKGAVNWISSGELKEHYIYSSKEQISEEAAKNLKLLPVGTFVIAIYGLEAEGVRGTGSITQEPSTISQACMSFIPKGVIENEFLYSWYKKHGNMIGIRYAQGTKQQNLSYDILEKFKIAYPNTKEQEKLNRFIFLLDERIATQNKIIEDLKKLKSAISKKLLYNDKWTTYKIQDIAEIGRGRVISSVEIERQKHPLYPVYSSQTSNDGIMGYLDNYMFDGEYITWTTDGANAGTVFYRKGKFNCTNVCGTLNILPKFDCYFVSLVLQQATQKYVSSNLANPKLMNNTMASIKIRMPNIETQKQLSKVFQTLDSCLLVHQQTCKMYLSEKQYLLRQMFI